MMKYNFKKAMIHIANQSNRSLRNLISETPHSQSSVYRSLRSQNPDFGILASLAEVAGVSVSDIVELAQSEE